MEVKIKTGFLDSFNNSTKNEITCQPRGRLIVMPHDVFISYSNRDKIVADALCADLENKKIRCWIAPRDVIPGTDYATALIEAISNSVIFVLVLSKESNKSGQVIREVQKAVCKEIPIILFRIENVESTEGMEYLLNNNHWLDATTPPLETHLEKLADTIGMLLSRKDESPTEDENNTTEGHSTSEKLVDRFAKKWESKHEEAPFQNRIKDAVEPPGALKPRFYFAVRRIDIQVQKLDQATKRFTQRDKAISAKIVEAKSRHDTLTLDVYERALVEIRTCLKIVINAKLALEQITLRLRTVSELGDIVSTLGPAVGVLRSVRSGLVSVFPEAENELGEIGNMLSGIMIEAGESSGTTIDFSKVNQNVSKILLDSETVAVQETKEQLLEFSTIMPSGKTEEEGRISKSTSEIPEEVIDNVHFSITAPAKVSLGSSFVVDVWAHLSEQRDEIIRRAKEELPGEEIYIKSKGPVNVSRGTTLTIRLKIAELEIDNSEDTLMWKNEIGNANFQVTVTKETISGVKPGIATVHVKGLQIARIYFSIQVGSQTTEPEKIEVNLEKNRQAFASYASEDRDYVLKCIQGIQKAAPQLEIFLDVTSLRSGQYWEKELWKIIPSKDVFYLFWSSYAARSKWVEKEWKCALESRGIDFIDPIPLESPDRAPPPTELLSKHFNDWTIAYMSRKQ